MLPFFSERLLFYIIKWTCWLFAARLLLTLFWELKVALPVLSEALTLEFLASIDLISSERLSITLLLMELLFPFISIISRFELPWKLSRSWQNLDDLMLQLEMLKMPIELFTLSSSNFIMLVAVPAVLNFFKGLLSMLRSSANLASSAKLEFSIVNLFGPDFSTCICFWKSWFIVWLLLFWILGFCLWLSDTVWKPPSVKLMMLGGALYLRPEGGLADFKFWIVL